MPNNVVTGTNNDVSLIMSYLPLPCSYNDAGLDVTLDNRTVLTCAEFWQPLGKRSGEGAAAHAGSIEGSRRGGQSYEPQYDFVGGGLSDEGDTRADKEDEYYEALGYERVAHLIQVSLDLPTDKYNRHCRDNVSGSNITNDVIARSVTPIDCAVGSDSTKAVSAMVLSSPSREDSCTGKNANNYDNEAMAITPGEKYSKSLSSRMAPAEEHTAINPNLASHQPLREKSHISSSVLASDSDMVTSRVTGIGGNEVSTNETAYVNYFRAGRLIKSASLDGLWVSSSSSSGRTGGDCGSNTAGGMSGNGMNPMLRGRGQYRQQPPSTDMEAAAQQPSVQQHEQHQQNVISHGGTFVTSVKLSPSGAYVLLGCSRGNVQERALDDKRPPWQHPVAAIWRLGDMKRMSTLTRSVLSLWRIKCIFYIHPFIFIYHISAFHCTVPREKLLIPISKMKAESHQTNFNY